ncbi:hypothetical protein L249_8326 [Ophiocordyceps polyrhachis-furcata BCC 54312]|uniref:Uncharacterized protein n=1 Tax=Ophiocordyceps polyrhachis-furcata BCC 54312 TaxID=1330021 RepID=A0A367KZB3_9HYPO|nr:hypothetical protein L249_8326 [Ophiocordyceps polyrhachis-furcata BCC 54312]
MFYLYIYILYKVKLPSSAGKYYSESELWPNTYVKIGWFHRSLKYQMVIILRDETMNNQQETKIISHVMSRILRDYT